VKAHLTDELSGYVDDQLTDEERAVVERHLAECPECAAVIEEERRLRDLLRGLPLVDPPFGFYERLLRQKVPSRPQRSWVRTALINVGAAAAAFAVVLGLASTGESSDEVAADEVITKSASIVPSLDQLRGKRATPAEAESAAHYGVPSSLAGTYQLAGFQLSDGIPQAVYSNGRQLLAVFVMRGRLDWGRLPNPRPVTVNGSPAWQVRIDDADVVLVQRPDAVVVITGPPAQTDPNLASQIQPELSERDSLADRVEEAGRRLLETFGLRG
jgi:hypothetical protein